MPEFAWPWMLLTLPLPWLATRWLPAAPRLAQAALRVPFARAFATLQVADEHAGGRRVRRWWPLIGWLLLCLAAARPQQAGDVVQPPRSGRDLLLAVDLSGSMRTEDMQLGGQEVDRLTAIKAVLGDFLTRRVGDRVGLIEFGTRAYGVTPLTWDRESVREQLLGSEPGLAGDNTAIGDAIALAVKRLVTPAADGTTVSERVLVLLTDGVSNAGTIEPLKAAQLAASEHVRIYTIGFGGGGEADTLLGINLPMQDDGVDEDTLRKIADQTGGVYYRARDTESLAGIYGALDRIEPALRGKPPERPRIELYPWFLGSALLLAIATIMLPPAGVRRQAA